MMTVRITAPPPCQHWIRLSFKTATWRKDDKGCAQIPVCLHVAHGLFVLCFVVLFVALSYMYAGCRVVSVCVIEELTYFMILHYTILGFGFVTFDSSQPVEKTANIHFHQINGKTV